VPKWLEIDQDNLHIKVLALNIDFSSLSPDLCSARPAHVGVKEGYPPKKLFFRYHGSHYSTDFIFPDFSGQNKSISMTNLFT